MSPAIDVLFSVPDLPKLLFSWLDRSSLALAAWVCKSWCTVARDVRGEGKRFRLVLADLVPFTPALIWVDKNIAKLSGRLRSKLCAIAAGKGALVTLQWARANSCEWDAFTCANAAKNGHLSVLQWARENGCVWAADTCSGAARNGRLSILQWAREKGCDWDAWTCAEAARNGHLELLRWARENDCPWNKAKCMSLAKGYNHLVVAAWIAAQPE